VGLGAFGRPAEFRFETDLVSGLGHFPEGRRKSQILLWSVQFGKVDKLRIGNCCKPSFSNAGCLLIECSQEL